MGSMIRIAVEDGLTFEAYLALPANGDGPGMVVLPEMYNLNSTFREVADGYAAEGFIVIAPDMYWRTQPGLFLEFADHNRQQARALYAALDRDLAVSDVGRCIEALRRRGVANGNVAIVGFCMGGEIAALAACRMAVDAVAMYYATKMEPHVKEMSTIKARTIMHFAENDQYIPLATVEAIRNETAALAHVSIHVYLDTGHAFARPRSAYFIGAATALANTRTLALFKNLFRRADV
jgi:carboxymethylenebutenolidase